MVQIRTNIKRMMKLKKQLEELSYTMEYSSVSLLGFQLTRADVDTTLMVIEMTLNGFNPYIEMPLAKTSLNLLEKSGAIEKIEFSHSWI